jgi:glycine cleavage system transcriptional repressor
VSEFAVTAIGADRPGIVAAVSTVLRDRGANVEDSAMTILGGHFAIVMLVEGDDTADGLQAALDDATADLGLTVHVTPATGGHASPDPTHLLSVYGPDRTGILAGVTAALAEAQANITDLETRLLGADGDAPVYAMVIELVAPDGGADAIAAAVAAACEELGVDHTLRAIEAETY